MLNDTLDKYGSHPHINRNLKEKVKSCIDFFNLKDVFRDFNPSKKNIYTNSNPALRSNTIGFFLVSNNLCGNFKSADISQSNMSDYKIATFFLDIELIKRGNRYSKINNTILNDIDFTKMIKRVINDFSIANTREYTSPHILWETSKRVIRGETILFRILQKKNQTRL